MVFWNQEPQSKVIVGLEIGTSKVVAAVAELRDDGQLTLLGIGEQPSTGIRKGEVMDFQAAQACVREALSRAEHETDAEIREVYLLLTGGHIQTRTDKVRCTILDEDFKVTEEAVEELSALAENLTIPRDHVIVHSLLQYYKLDNGDISRNPLGLNSQGLEGYYHLIFGLHTRLQSTVRCVADLGVKVTGHALASYAAGYAVLDENAKNAGSVVIDFGAGVTNYIVYYRGAVAHTGVLALGGDHLTQDLSVGLRLPFLRAEQLKREHGDLFMNGHHADEKIVLERDMSSEERHLYRESMVKILHARQEEILRLVIEDIESHGLWNSLSGDVVITGGASQIRGLETMAREMFPLDVRMIREHEFFDGDLTCSTRPDLTAVFGLLNYARRKELASMQTKGWNRVRNAVGSLLSAMKLF